MSIAIERVSAEALPRVGEVIAPMAEGPGELPHIVSAPRPVAWVPHAASWFRVAVSVGISLLGHAGVLAWLGYWPTGLAMPWIPVESGRASIDLQASLASAPAAEEQEGEVELELASSAQMRPRRPVRRPEPKLAAASTELPPLAPGQIGFAPLPRPSGTDSQQPFPDDLPARIDRKASETLPPKLFEPAAEAESSVPRADMGPRHARLVAVHASIASLASPGSEASDGAEASVPAVVYNPAPAYPPAALAARQAGRVVLRVGIAPDGTVRAVRVGRSSGVVSLDRAAVEAVRRWRFATAESGSASTRWVAVPIRFAIVEPTTSAS